MYKQCSLQPFDIKNHVESCCLIIHKSLRVETGTTVFPEHTICFFIRFYQYISSVVLEYWHWIYYIYVVCFSQHDATPSSATLVQVALHVLDLVDSCTSRPPVCLQLWVWVWQLTSFCQPLQNAKAKFNLKVLLRVLHAKFQLFVFWLKFDHCHCTTNITLSNLSSLSNKAATKAKQCCIKMHECMSFHTHTLDY